MLTEPQQHFSLEEIIEQENCVTHFHPIVSVQKRSVVGLEALTRGVDSATAGLISPDELFKAAAEQELTVPLDRLCREKAIQTFAGLTARDGDLLLFLNFDPSIIDKGVVGSGRLINNVRETNISPEKVVLEIVESKVLDTAALQRFVSTYKEYGFLIALDDVGSGYSNFDRIPLIKPDILKLDRGIITQIDKNYYHQEIFKALVNLAKKIGSLVLAEGVETADEAVKVMELGADMLQGFYFGKPGPVMDTIDSYGRRIDLIALKFRSWVTQKINREEKFQAKTYGMAKDFAAVLAKSESGDFDVQLKMLITGHPAIESMYVLDHLGTQVSETISRPNKALKSRGSIFSPAAKGADHSLKNYYLFLRDDVAKHITEPYISMASGSLCVTVSIMFNNLSKRRFILCIDSLPDHIYASFPE